MTNHVIIVCLTQAEIAIYEKLDKEFAINFSKKLQSKNPEFVAEIFYLDPDSGFTSEQIAALKAILNKPTELHIVGHCNAGSAHLSTEYQKGKIGVEVLVYVLTEIIGKKTKDKPITINLVACRAAEKNETNNSFAHEFHNFLKIYGIYSLVKAWNTTIITSLDGTIKTFKKGEEKRADVLLSKKNKLRRWALKLSVLHLIKLEKEILAREKQHLQVINEILRRIVADRHIDDWTVFLARTKPVVQEIYEINSRIMTAEKNLAGHNEELLKIEADLIEVGEDILTKFSPKAGATSEEISEVFNQAYQAVKSISKELDVVTLSRQPRSKVIHFFDGEDTQSLVFHPYGKPKQDIEDFVNRRGCYSIVAVDSKENRAEAKAAGGKELPAQHSVFFSPVWAPHDSTAALLGTSASSAEKPLPKPPGPDNPAAFFAPAAIASGSGADPLAIASPLR